MNLWMIHEFMMFSRSRFDQLLFREIYSASTLEKDEDFLFSENELRSEANSSQYLMLFS